MLSLRRRIALLVIAVAAGASSTAALPGYCPSRFQTDEFGNGQTYDCYLSDQDDDYCYYDCYL